MYNDVEEDNFNWFFISRLFLHNQPSLCILRLFYFFPSGRKGKVGELLFQEKWLQKEEVSVSLDGFLLLLTHHDSHYNITS
jgi:hypothetical protein